MSASVHFCELPSLPYLEVIFSCRLTSDAIFSPYKGSMLRGSLGFHLRKGLCMTRSKDCASCMLAKNCIFPRLFHPLPSDGVSAPPPFCLEPDMGDKCQYKTGELFEFGLKIFTYAVEYLPFFVQAFRMAGEKGLGDPRCPGKFVLEKVSSSGNSIYDQDADSLDMPDCLDLADSEAGAVLAASRGLAVRLCTPLRHKSDNHFSASLEFSELFHLILRRIKGLCLGTGVQWRLPPEQYASLRAAAAQIAIAENGLHWHDWTRYSSRQETYMKLGGLLGTINYSGDITAFKKLLQLARIAHIGKQTSFGLGRLELEYL